MISRNIIKTRENLLCRLRHNVVVVEALQEFPDCFIDLHLVTRPVFMVPIHGYVEKRTLEKKEFVYAGRARVRPTDSRAGNIKSSLCACLTINARSTVGTSFDTARCLFTLLKPYIFVIEKCLVLLISRAFHNRDIHISTYRVDLLNLKKGKSYKQDILYFEKTERVFYM